MEWEETYGKNCEWNKKESMEKTRKELGRNCGVNGKEFIEEKGNQFI